MADGLIAAIWNGPFDAELPSGTVRRGEQAFVTEADLVSDHWERVKGARKIAPDKVAEKQQDGVG